MDSSSHTRPKKPLLVIGNMTNSGSSHPKPSGYSSNSELRRDSRNYDDRHYNNLPLKKSRTKVDYNTQSRGVHRTPDMGIENGKHGHGISEAVSGNEAGELQKVKEESAKQVAKLQRQKGQLELQLKDSKCKIEDLEKTHELKDHSEKMVAELINQLKQSTATIKDLVKMQNLIDDESEKKVAELQRQKALLEEESKKVNDESTKLVAKLQRQKALLEEESKKVRDESTKLVAKLQRQKSLLEIESEKLKQSEAKNQDLEYKLKNAAEDFFQERAHRDSTEHDLRKRLREALATIHSSIR